MWRGRNLWAEIDMDALSQNIGEIRRRIGPRPEILAVVKANAYGHGAVPVARALLEAGAQRLGVACVDEGIQLRDAGINAPILIMGYSPPYEAQRIVRHSLTSTPLSREEALALASFSQQEGVITSVHIKVDTGMARFGLLPKEAIEFAEFLRGLPGLELEGIYSHLANADEADKSFAREQFRLFTQVAEALPWVSIRHIANSAAICDLPEMLLDMVRPGISLYGCYPSQDVGRSISLSPVLSLKSRLARLHTLAPGQSVSYGRTWVAKEPTTVALITCGYADGIPRLLSNRGSVLVRGQRAPIVGRICMDQFMVDVTHIEGTTEGDEVVIIGRQGHEEIRVEEVAELAGTISYEVLCAISPRVPRVYLEGGQVREVSTLLSDRSVVPATRVLYGNSL